MKLKEISLEEYAWRVDDAVAVLRTYSLIQRNTHERTFSVHRMVQAVLQDVMEEQEHISWITRVVCAVKALIAEEYYEDQDRWKLHERGLAEEYLLPHLLACEGWMTQRNLILQEGSSLLTMAASYFRDGEQERFYKRALAIDEQLGDPGQFKGSLGQLADFYRLKERYAEAELLYNRLIAACDEEKDNFNLYYLEKVADFYRKQKRYAEAEPLYKRAMAIHERTHAMEVAMGLPGSYMAMYLNTLASVYQKQGKYAEAEPLYERSLTIYERWLGRDNPKTAHLICRLADLYYDQRKYPEAKLLYERALEIYEQHCEPEDVSRFMTRTRYTILLQSIKSDEDLKKLKEDP